MNENLYNYRATVLSVYDGDTIRVDIDLGMKAWIRNEKIRLARINTPELRGSERPQGIAARDFLKNLIHGKKIILQTIKDAQGKYGRYLGEIWLEIDGIWTNMNDLLVEKGHAKYAKY